jgi:hypothetical protein
MTPKTPMTPMTPNSLNSCWASLSCVVLFISGCTIHVQPPTQVQDPVKVYLVDSGDTGRLWLPNTNDPEPTYTQWCFGDWKWFALNDQNPLYGLVVFVVPTPGALGRAPAAGPPTNASGQPRVPCEVIHEITVEWARARALNYTLATRFRLQIDTEIYNQERGLWFVQDKDVYWLLNQSSTQTAYWLQALGCQVHGFTLIANFSVAPPGVDIPGHR